MIRFILFIIACFTPYFSFSSVQQRSLLTDNSRVFSQQAHSTLLAQRVNPTRRTMHGPRHTGTVRRAPAAAQPRVRRVQQAPRVQRVAPARVAPLHRGTRVYQGRRSPYVYPRRLHQGVPGRYRYRYGDRYRYRTGFWNWYYPGILTAAMILYYLNNEPVYACRAKYGRYYYDGELRSKRCYINVRGRIIGMTRYMILVE